ncbi:ankyrin-1 [Caerostris extrusa]|uniref:Ankyrin-1 n=1 Tax=Caerostris extrusa TaxID=172846 RepID=A0AAV4MLS3_CAEEX|nr:ankyrin-1 [Caerostris extrusa]
MTALHFASLNGHIKIIDALMKTGCDALAEAALEGHVNVVDLLKVKAKVDIYANNERTAIEMAAIKGHLPVELYGNCGDDSLTSGCLIQSSGGAEDFAGQRSLRYGKEIIICIKGGAAVNAQIHHLSPLHHASAKGSLIITNILLKHGANPNNVDPHGLTPLHYAAEFGKLKIVKKLLSYGAVFNALSEDNRTPKIVTNSFSVRRFLHLIERLFTKVEDPSSCIVHYIRNLRDQNTVKAIMNAQNREKKTLIACAIHYGFPEVEALKEILQEDLRKVHRMANAYYYLEDHNQSELKFKSIHEFRSELFWCKQSWYIRHRRKKLPTHCFIGKTQYAIKCFQNIYEFPFKHYPGSLEASTRISVLLSLLNEYEKALEINYKLQKENNHLFGISESLQIENNIALIYSHQGKYAHAYKIWHQLYESKAKLLGPAHPSTLRTLRDVGMVLFSQQKYNQALKILHKVLDIQQIKLGSDHFDTLSTNNQIGDIFFAQGKHFNALKIYDKDLSRRKIILGPNHPEVCETLRKIDQIRCLYIMESCAVDLNFMQQLPSNIPAYNHRERSVSAQLYPASTCNFQKKNFREVRKAKIICFKFLALINQFSIKL